MAIMNCFELPVQQPDTDMSVQEFKEWIKQFDTDHDKRISREELTEALESLHMWFSSWKARRVMKDADTDHTYSDFVVDKGSYLVVVPRGNGGVGLGFPETSSGSGDYFGRSRSCLWVADVLKKPFFGNS
ncbi:hypothetical protein RND71_019604 [Anisodus tanguticus]|uniref:EF-hand domain-containing protein n=1 Tax=Anisodus tanguticus TaxID=243964 RepID=A0AAE1V9H9_9SOLA|nr:hypothetical protein RND71_019604 [Anisodus tanguticus]